MKLAREQFSRSNLLAAWLFPSAIAFHPAKVSAGSDFARYNDTFETLNEENWGWAGSCGL